MKVVFGESRNSAYSDDVDEIINIVNELKDRLSALPNDPSNYVHVFRQDKYEDFEGAYIALKDSVSRDVSVTKVQTCEYSPNGIAEAYGKPVRIINTKLFAAAMSGCTCFEVYPLLDGTIKILFSFNGIEEIMGKGD